MNKIFHLYNVKQCFRAANTFPSSTKFRGFSRFEDQYNYLQKKHKDWTLCLFSFFLICAFRVPCLPCYKPVGQNCEEDKLFQGLHFLWRVRRFHSLGTDHCNQVVSIRPPFWVKIVTFPSTSSLILEVMLGRLLSHYSRNGRCSMCLHFHPHQWT